MGNFRFEDRLPENLATKLERIWDDYLDVLIEVSKDIASKDRNNSKLTYAAGTFENAKERGGFCVPSSIRDDGTHLYDDFTNTLVFITSTYNSASKLKQPLLKPMIDRTREAIQAEIQKGDPQGAIRYIKGRNDINELFIQSSHIG